jgi:predicted RND superfamily exporter protein
MLFIEVGDYDSGASKGRDLLGRVKADVAALGGLEKYAPGMRLGYASDIAINVEETEALETDLGVSSVVVVFAVMAVLLVFFKWWKSVLILFPPLLLATGYAFGLASLPPMNVTELNSNTAFLGSIIIGNGINVGLILLARYREERRRGLSVDEAITVAVYCASLGTLAAAAAAAVSYASLVVTEFRGFRQFGYIGGFGLVCSWLTAFVLMPPLMKWLDKGPAPTGKESHGPFDLFTSGVVKLVTKWPAAVVALATVVTLASAAILSTWTTSRLETNFSVLRRVDTWKDGEGYWGRKMDAALGRYLTPTVILTDSVEQARLIEDKVRASMKPGGALTEVLAQVRTIDDIVPAHQAEKMVEIEAIRELMTPKIRSLVPDDKREQLDKMIGDDSLKPFTSEEVPRVLLTGLREKDGTVGKSVLVFPKPSNLLWERAYIDSFVRTLRGFGKETAIPGQRPARLAGSIPMTSDILTSIDHDAPLATVVAFVGVVLTVLLVVRRATASSYVIGALVIGVLWLAGAMMALDIKINFCNFIAFPITLGIGVDYAVNVMVRFVQDGQEDVTGAVKSTGGAVTLCSSTTIIGYSSLLLAKNKALYLFGLLAVAGEVTCLVTAVIALPALLVILARRRA